nr:MFS transporter [Xanthobacter autotrophicus]
MATLFLTAGLVLLNGMLFGFSTASIAGVVGTISEAFALSTRATEMMVTSLLAGCFVGAVLAAPISQRIGRRPSCLLAATLAFAGYALVPLGQAMAPGVGMLVAARIFIGLGVGLSSMVVPMYAAEVTPARHRGAVVSLFQLAVTIGILLGYAVPLALTGHATWAQMLGGDELAVQRHRGGELPLGGGGHRPCRHHRHLPRGVRRLALHFPRLCAGDAAGGAGGHREGRARRKSPAPAGRVSISARTGIG